MKDFILIFTSIFYEALPFIVVGAIIAGVLEEMLPQNLIARILPKSKLLGIGMGALLGLTFPMCECGIIPVMRRLLRKGLPLSCCVAYLLAGPIINPVVLFSTYVAFSGMENATEGGRLSYQMGGIMMVICRLSMAFLVSVVTSLVVDRLYQKHGNTLLTPLALPPKEDATGENSKGKNNSGFSRLSRISETALHDFIDISVYLTLGALLAAFSRIWFSHETIAELSRANIAAAILLMMGFAVLLCLCSEADAFVAASFVTLRPAAKLGFLVIGPMVDLKLYMMYTQVFRPKLIWTIFLTVALQVFLYTMIVHYLWENLAPRYVTPPAVTVKSN
ncbi:MAG: permease [Gemmataceae bacterium]|nr:permease [Gemmataceae bacterium]